MLPVSHGAYAFATALSLLLRIDPYFAQEIHDQQKIKPITVGPLTGPFQQEGTNFCLSPSHLFFWRLTGLNQAASERLLCFSPALGGLRINKAVFKIVQVATQANQHPEAGQDTYASLVSCWTHQKEAPPAFTLHFVTPTTFRQGSFEIPFPLPHLVWGSLLDRWNMFSSSLILDREFKREFEEGLLLANWSGETRRVEMGRRRTVGFLGKFTYRLADSHKKLQSLLAMLAEFAFYAGVGWQTSHGMGQSRWLFP
jgi:CRISPR-associated endoribonuclease Cas6